MLRSSWLVWKCWVFWLIIFWFRSWVVSWKFSSFVSWNIMLVFCCLLRLVLLVMIFICCISNLLLFSWLLWVKV